MMDRVKSEEVIKIRKGKRNLSSINFEYTKSRKSQISGLKTPILPMLNPSFKSTEKFSDTYNQSSLHPHPIQKTPDKLISKFNRIFDKKLEERLKNIEKSDEKQIIKVYLELFEKIIAVDAFGSILEKIRMKLVNFINKLATKDEPELALQKLYDQDIGKYKEMLKDLENSKKSVEAKLKKLSLENIELLNTVEKLKDEIVLLKDFKKNVKIVDGVPDAMPILKELRTKTTMLDSIDKKNKVLMKKERYLMALIRALKEKGMNPNELVGMGNIERRSSSDSMNISRISIGSELSRLS